jgi:hypothetical protein
MRRLPMPNAGAQLAHARDGMCARTEKTKITPLLVSPPGGGQGRLRWHFGGTLARVTNPVTGLCDL